MSSYRTSSWPSSSGSRRAAARGHLAAGSGHQQRLVATGHRAARSAACMPFRHGWSPRQTFKSIRAAALASRLPAAAEVVLTEGTRRLSNERIEPSNGWIPGPSDPGCRGGRKAGHGGGQRRDLPGHRQRAKRDLRGLDRAPAVCRAASPRPDARPPRASSLRPRALDPIARRLRCEPEADSRRA